jgi:hypothetical protein
MLKDIPPTHWLQRMEALFIKPGNGTGAKRPSCENKVVFLRA